MAIFESGIVNSKSNCKQELHRRQSGLYLSSAEISFHLRLVDNRRQRRTSMTGASAPVLIRKPSSFGLGLAWILMWFALAIHVADEALTGFLAVYNPTVLALRAQLGFWPMPTLGFREWLSGLTIGIFVLAVLSPFAFRNERWIRAILYFLAIVTGILNALGHTLGTILGHTVSTVRFPRPAPGFYSSSLLLIVSVYALVQLRRTRPDRA